MAFKPLGGASRRYLNTLTGETISRRQYQKLQQGISFEEKARRNRERDLAAAIARPARGRTKARTQQEIELRLEAAREKATQEKVRRLEKKAAAAAKRVRVKKIRPQLLKSGHRAERIPFLTYDDYADLWEQMNSQRAPNGKRLITSYGLGIVGFDERTGQEIAATLYTLMSPRVEIDEGELADVTEEFVESKPYFIFSHYYLHLHFDIEYAEMRAKKARRK